MAAGKPRNPRVAQGRARNAHWLLLLPLLASSGASGCGSSHPADPDGGAADGGTDGGSCPAPAPGPSPGRFAPPLPSAGHGLGDLLPAPRGSGPLVPLAPPRRARPRIAAAVPTAVDQRLLLISATGDEPAFHAASGALARIGVPFTVMIANQETLDATALWTDDGTCRYAGVVLVQSELGYEDGLGNWVSAFDETEWQLLDDYEIGCDAREVAWYAYPSEANGLAVASSFDDQVVVDADLTADGIARFSYLRPDAPVELAGVWGYTGTVVDGSVTTVLMQNTAGEALAVIHRRPDGRELLAMTFDSSQWTPHAFLLEYGVIDWVSRGMFLGMRRIYLTPHIDDVFIDAELWGQVGVAYRNVPADVDFIADWQDGISASLPAGSSFMTYLFFNGSGTDPDYYPDGTPIVRWKARQGSFLWANHTWTHTNMDAMSRERAAAEVTADCDLAADWAMPGFSCAALVTPEISGLDYPNSLDGIISAGVSVVVSDTSVTEQINPDNPGTNPSFNVGRVNPWRSEIYQVPRHPTNVFFNVSTADEEVELFNYLYRDYYGREMTYDEIVAINAEVAIRYLLSYDVDPLMFHQADLRAFTGSDAQQHSLYSDWVEALIARYTAVMTLPIQTLSLEQIARVMRNRGAFDSCGVQAIRRTDDTGSVLELSAAADCTVPITGLDAPAAGEVEVYGGVPTTLVDVSACATVTIPLPE